LQVLAPTPYLAAKGPGSVDRKGRRITSNTVSIVIRVKTDAGPVALLASDLDSLGLEYLLGDGVDVSAPFLVFPHHGGKPGTEDGRAFAQRICAAAKPEAVVFSTGRGRYATPSPDVIAGVLEARPKCWIACTQLSETCAAVVPKHDGRHLAHTHAQGREAGRCCAGSITIPLRDPTNVKPTRRSHAAFVRECVEAPLCRLKARPVPPCKRRNQR
jgi:competence protein ComEC